MLAELVAGLHGNGGPPADHGNLREDLIAYLTDGAGVLHDLARKLLAREPIDLTMGHANIIWQGDANDWVLRALAHCTTPTSGLNLSGPPQRIRDLAQALAQRLSVQPVFTGSEATTAWLVDIAEARRLFGEPAVPLATMLDWTADWVSRGMASLDKPTHYEARDGKY